MWEGWEMRGKARLQRKKKSQGKGLQEKCLVRDTPQLRGEEEE